MECDTSTYVIVGDGQMFTYSVRGWRLSESLIDFQDRVHG